MRDVAEYIETDMAIKLGCIEMSWDVAEDIETDMAIN